jgi:hypothetical protein
VARPFVAAQGFVDVLGQWLVRVPSPTSGAGGEGFVDAGLRAGGTGCLGSFIYRSRRAAGGAAWVGGVGTSVTGETATLCKYQQGTAEDPDEPLVRKKECELNREQSPWQ